MTNDRFRDILHIDFSDRMDINTKNKLSILMRNRGYHVRNDKENKQTILLSPSQSQLDYAWNYLKYGIVENKGIEFRPDSLIRVEYLHDNVFRLRDKKTGRFAKKE